MFIEIAICFILIMFGFIVGYILRSNGNHTARKLLYPIERTFQQKAYIAGSEQDTQLMEENKEYKIK